MLRFGHAKVNEKRVTTRKNWQEQELQMRLCAWLRSHLGSHCGMTVGHPAIIIQNWGTRKGGG
jgi:hypothetical protein